MVTFEEFVREAAILQSNYNKLVLDSKLTKKNLCDLCVPFRDKYNLTDRNTLAIARSDNKGLSWLISVFEESKGVSD